MDSEKRAKIRESIESAYRFQWIGPSEKLFLIYVLDFMHKNGIEKDASIAVSDIADYLRINQRSVSKMINLLCARGYCEAKKDSLNFKNTLFTITVDNGVKKDKEMDRW